MIYPEFELKPQLFSRYPFDWNKIFGNLNRLHVELGFGNGEYISYCAEKNKDINYVGFELSITSMVKAQRKLKRKNLENVKLILCDAKFGLREFFSDESIDKVIMNFPVPWYKNSQSHRRIIIKEFFEILSVVLKIDGEFELVTDQEWYAKEAYENAQESGKFKVYKIERNPKREFLTRYEKKWLKFNRDIFRLIVKKEKKGSIIRLLGSDDVMPHAISRISEEKIFDIKGKIFKDKDKDKVFVIKNVYKELKNNAYIFKVISSDRDFSQHYFLVLYPKDDGRWVLKLDSESNPYRTPAVKWSVKKIMEVLE